MAEPSDDIIQQAIISSLEGLDVDSVRPNKLRKLVCRKSGCNWDQYAGVLTVMIEDKEVKTRQEKGEQVLLKLAGAKSSKDKDENEERNQLNKITIMIPTEVAFNMIRKDRAKQKKIEMRTGTKLEFRNLDRLKLNSDAKVTITADSSSKFEAVEEAINKLTRAYKKNPNAFGPQKKQKKNTDTAEDDGKEETEDASEEEEKSKKTKPKRKTEGKPNKSQDEEETDKEPKIKKKRRFY